MKEITKTGLKEYLNLEIESAGFWDKKAIIVTGGVLRDLLHAPHKVIKDIDVMIDSRYCSTEDFDNYLIKLWNKFSQGLTFPGFEQLELGKNYGDIEIHHTRNWQITPETCWKNSLNEQVTIQVSYHTAVERIFTMMSETMNGMYWDGEYLHYTANAPEHAEQGIFSILNVDTNFLTPVRAQGALDRIEKFKKRGYVFKEDPHALELLTRLAAGEKGMDSYSIATPVCQKLFNID